MTLLPDSGEPRNLMAGTVLDTAAKPALLTDATWQHLNERYQLRGELGEGGQAVVLLVKERAAPQRRLAIKVYHENTEVARKLFDHECRVLASDHLPQDLVVGYVQCVSESIFAAVCGPRTHRRQADCRVRSSRPVDVRG